MFFVNIKLFVFVKYMYVLNMLQIMLMAGYMINMDQPLIMCVLRTRQF
jgi:hypothetical protein